MNCMRCGHENPDGANFCNYCGATLEQPTLQGISFYGIFYRGGYGDGYNTSLGFHVTPEGELRLQNSPAMLSRNRPDEEQFLGEVTEIELYPEDSGTYVSSRWKVLRWWKLTWNGEKWEIAEELMEHPESLGLSNFERG